jgi:hypothetical protein
MFRLCTPIASAVVPTEGQHLPVLVFRQCARNKYKRNAPADNSVILSIASFGIEVKAISTA